MMHGECVAAGCVAEAEVTLRLGIESALDRSKIERITACFASYGLPVHVPRGLDLETLMRKMALDKKNLGNSIRCTIVTDIGVSIAQPQPVPSKMMQEVMRDSMAAGVAVGPEWVPHGGHHHAAGGQMAA